MSKAATLILLANIYPAVDVEPYDGDTFKASIVLAIEPDMRVRRSVRVQGIDTPELGARAECESERALAKRARDIAAAWLKEREVFVTQVKRGKFAGRVLAVVRDANGNTLADHLIGSGVARAYSGRGPRAGWCAQGYQ